MFTSGDFSRISGLSIKALRLYHEAEILVPKLVDRDTGYRYYDHDNVERARVIVLLRQMLFSVEEIKNLVQRCGDDVDALAFFESQRTELESRIRQMKHAKAALDEIVESERHALTLIKTQAFQIEEKVLPAVTIAGLRRRGQYAEIGAAFATLGRAIGGLVAGKPFGLFYDGEYRETDADFEGCFPVKREKSLKEVAFRQLPGGRAVTMIYQGPYHQVGRSYAKVLSYINEMGYHPLLPTREVYIKGPGMIFKGNPKNYLTDIQILVNY